jgi:hypothetical protein
LDDVWDVDAIQPLLNALPNQACLLVTTRSRRVAQELHGEIYPLDVLTPSDATSLLRTRLPRAQDEDEVLLESLCKALGYHAQALDIAAGSLARRDRKRWETAIEEMARQVREGSGFGELHLPGDEEIESRVEAALFTSYSQLKPPIQARFRRLGAFAPDGSFRLESVAGLWKLSPEEAEDQLSVFVELGLLNQLEETNPETRWQQHSLLRAYALALLRRESEEHDTRKEHALIHNELIRSADDRQIYFVMLPDYPQLRHAFFWALENDLELAQNLAGNTANLQATFYLVRENYTWALQLLEASNESPQEIRGRAIGTLANALSRLANLPDEDRRARLLEALDAYNEALKFRRPDTAPLDYAMTQNNRGTVLSDLAASPDEDRRARLLEALDAYNEALKFRRPDTAPLDYAMTQNNRGTVLRDLAASPDEDRRARLLEALDAYNEALHHYRPDTAPLDYAMTQGNLGYLHAAFLELPGEEKKDRYEKAIACVVTALSIFSQVGHAPFAQQAVRQLHWLAEQAGEFFEEIWEELELGELPDWLK